MGYRDDREALRQHADALSAELEAARRELEATRARLAAHEGKDVEDERRIAELTKRLAKLEGRSGGRARRSQSSRAVLALVGGVVVLAGAMGMAVALRAKPPPPAPSPVAATPPAKPAAAPKPADQARSARVTFHARVAKASGTDLSVGATCTLSAELTATGARRDVRDLELSCGATRLYKRGDNDGQTIFSNSRWDFEEARAPKAGELRYRLLFEDKGQRSSRLFQILVDTRERRARLWRDEPDRASIDLTVDEWSEGRAGEPLIGTTR